MAAVQALRDNPHCVLATTPCGGHLGWVSGEGGPLDAPWSNEVMMQWLLSVLQGTREGLRMPGASPAAAAEVQLVEAGASK